jgi:hypothetical protein
LPEVKLLFTLGSVKIEKVGQKLKAQAQRKFSFPKMYSAYFIIRDLVGIVNQTQNYKSHGWLRLPTSTFCPSTTSGFEHSEYGVSFSIKLKLAHQSRHRFLF